MPFLNKDKMKTSKERGIPTGLKSLLSSKPLLPVKKNSNKDKGTAYEVYVGSLYEKKGYSVDYNGIKKGSKDGCIDLICKLDMFTVLVQCKCYTNSRITFKDICYFYGSVDYYAAEHREEVVHASYWTSRKISPCHEVFRVIKALGITLHDGVMMPKHE